MLKMFFIAVYTYWIPETSHDAVGQVLSRTGKGIKGLSLLHCSWNYWCRWEQIQPPRRQTNPPQETVEHGHRPASSPVLWWATSITYWRAPGCFAAGVLPPQGFTPCTARGGTPWSHPAQAQQQTQLTRLPGDSSRRLVLGGVRCRQVWPRALNTPPGPEDTVSKAAPAAMGRRCDMGGRHWGLHGVSMPSRSPFTEGFWESNCHRAGCPVGAGWLAGNCISFLE